MRQRSPTVIVIYVLLGGVKYLTPRTESFFADRYNWVVTALHFEANFEVFSTRKDSSEASK